MNTQVSSARFVGNSYTVLLPSPRGPLSTTVFDALRGAPRPLPHIGRFPLPETDDFQITLWTLQELSFRRVDGVDPDWEDEASFLALRATMERAQEWDLRRRIVQPPSEPTDAP